MSLKRRVAALSALAAAAVIGISVMGAVPANAATNAPTSVSPAFAAVCGNGSGGNVCVQTASKNSTTASVNAWAFRTTFTGFFELLNGCGGLFGKSPTRTWPGGGTHFTFTNIHYEDCGNDWVIIGETSSGGIEGDFSFNI